MKTNYSLSFMIKSTKLLFLFFSILFFSTTQINAFQNNTAPPLYEDGNIYLKVKDDSAIELGLPGNSNNPQDIETIFTMYGVTEIQKPFEDFNTHQFDRIYKLTHKKIEEPESLFRELNQLPYIQYVEKVPYKIKDQIQPNDPSVSISSQSFHLNLINAYDAFQLHQGGSLIAIVDDAVRTTHEDLSANFFIGRDVADSDDDPTNPNFTHGTRVAGVACGRTNNNLGIASIGWQNSIMAVKVKTDASSGNSITHGYEGIMWAALNNAKIINTSWGSTAYSESEYQCIIQARDLGAIIVSSAGNEGYSNRKYPASYGNGLTNEPWEIIDKNLVIAVASLDESGIRSSFSNYGHWVDIAAYGRDIFTTSGTEDNGYINTSGTSFSAPLVAGLIGLMKSYEPNATNDEIINCLLNSANTDIYNPTNFPDNIPGTLGTGRLDAEAALLCLKSNCSNPQAFIFPSSQLICPNGNITLSSNTGTGYLWSTGETSQIINVGQAGTYTVTVTFDNTCTAIKSIDIETVTNALPIIYGHDSQGNTIPDNGEICGDPTVFLTAFWG
ncbi:MAG: S8 family serine peptidase, partial [Saprospiraceae bacterium]